MRTYVQYIKENYPSVAVLIDGGDYILRIGKHEVTRLDGSETIRMKQLQGFIQALQADGYENKDKTPQIEL
jgi:hypothetical protein